jgi:ubiquinone/menaquinone biosynthesis C-methylase UbiE
MSDVTAAHYVTGVVGLGLLRTWHVDGSINEQRTDELRQLLDGGSIGPLARPLNPVERDLKAGYAEWAVSYDSANFLIEVEQSVVGPILDDLCGHHVDALDAGCGTGRHAVRLAERGCTTVGIDLSDAMLREASAKAASAHFAGGDLRALPFPDATFDLVVSSLAICHLPEPSSALRELARVLRPGGTLVVSDPHPTSETVGGQAFYGGARGGRQLTWVRNHHHSASTWLDGFRRSDLDVVQCLEPSYTDRQIESMPAAQMFPAAVRAALGGMPCLWVWVARRKGREAPEARAATRTHPTPNPFSRPGRRARY